MPGKVLEKVDRHFTPSLLHANVVVQRWDCICRQGCWDAQGG